MAYLALLYLCGLTLDLRPREVINHFPNLLKLSFDSEMYKNNNMQVNICFLSYFLLSCQPLHQKDESDLENKMKFVGKQLFSFAKKPKDTWSPRLICFYRIFPPEE